MGLCSGRELVSALCLGLARRMKGRFGAVLRGRGEGMIIIGLGSRRFVCLRLFLYMIARKNEGIRVLGLCSLCAIRSSGMV